MGIIEGLHEYVTDKLACQMLNLATSSCNLLLQIIEQTAELQRIRLGKFVITEKDFNLRHEILELLETFKV